MTSWMRQIEDDLSWREGELASLKVEVAKADPGTVKHTGLLRALWALLYAHYEGFVKFAWDLYLGEIERASVQRNKCKDEIVRLSLEKFFREARKDISSDALWSMCIVDFARLLEDKITFDIKLETESNLWPNVMQDNCARAMLPHEMVDLHAVQLRALVSRRNDIAHGKRMQIKDLKEYEEYEKAVMLVMHELGVAVVEVLEKKLYLRAEAR